MQESEDEVQKQVTAAEEKDEPQIRFGDRWIPAHLALEKMEIVTSVTNMIDRFNSNFPKLSSPLTRSVVPTTRVRLKNYELRNPVEEEPVDIASVAVELLQHMDPESVLDELDQKHQQALNLPELIKLAGEEHYLNALKREAIDFQQNRILPVQTAQIWAEMSRPALGGGLWTQKKVEELIQGPLDL